GLLAVLGLSAWGQEGGQQGTTSMRGADKPPRVVQAQRFVAQRGLRPGQRILGVRRGSAHAADVGPQTSVATATWEPLGPKSVLSANYGLVSGRVTAIAFDPADATGNRLYVGTTGGGVWVSQNAGTSDPSNVVFAPLTDTIAA